MKNSPVTSSSVVLLTAIVLMLCAPVLSHAALVAAWGDNRFGQCRPPNGLINVKAIAAGSQHSLALTSEGKVVAWGQLDGGATIVPAGLSGVRAIAAGGNWNLALKTDGTVVGWGAYNADLHVAGLSNVTAIAAGWYHWLALKSDGSLVSWSTAGNSYTPTNIPPGLTNVVAIAAGLEFSLALKADGGVVAWGWNEYGQTNVPPGLSNVVAISASTASSHCMALKTDGSIVAWGGNWEGQTNIPTGLANVTAMSGGHSHSLALRANGLVAAWGNANGTFPNYGQSVLPPDMSNVTAIAAGGYHSLALVQEGPVQIVQSPQDTSIGYTSNATLSVVATGFETVGYWWLFNGAPITPNVRIFGTTNATLTISNAQFSDIGNYSVIVSNAFGSVISSNATLTVISPPFITSRTADQTLRAGSSLLLSVVASGTPPLSYQWMLNGTNLAGSTFSSFFITDAQPEHTGVYSVIVSNAYGTVSTNIAVTVTNSAPYFTSQPRITTTDLRTTLTSPLPIGSSVALSLSDTRGSSLIVKGSLPLSYQWKFNGVDIPGATNTSLLFNQLRYDQSGFYNVEVSNAFGSTNSAKLLLNVSQVMIAGTPFTGNTNLPLALSNVIAVAGGGSHVMALRSDGTVRTWMANANYVFDSQAYAVTNIPPSATNVIAIAAGRDHCLALRSNGTVVAWGGNGFGQTNVPLNLSNVISVAGGQYRSYAVKSDGTVTGWGNQPAVPVGLSNVVAVAAGPSQNLVLRRDGTMMAWGSGTLVALPPGLSNFIAIAAGSVQNRALRRDGTVVTWTSSQSSTIENDGKNFYSNAVAIAVGNGVSVMLRQDGTITNSGFAQGAIVVSTNISAIAAGGVQSGFGVMAIGNGSPNFTLHPYSQIVQRSNTVQLHARAVGVQPMRYQWLFDNLPLPGATNSSLILSNVLGKDTGAYRMIASNALGVATSQIANISIPFSTNLPAALNTTNMQWSNVGTTNWFAQNRETHDGDVTAQSGVIANNQQSILQTTITGPGTLTFWWKVSSEEDYDFLRFYLNNTVTPLVSISGEVGWEQRSFAVPSGSHTLRWVYSKDGSVSAGRDAGWLDEVVYTRETPVMIRHPYNQIVPMGATVTIPAFASSSTPMTFQWIKNGTNLFGATDQYLTLTNATRRDSAIYALRVSNVGGSIMSSNATLKVIVRQRLGIAGRTADGSMEIFSRDADGGALNTNDLRLFEAQASTNLLNWQTLPDVLSVTNGSLLLRDPAALVWPQRFYRMVEH